MSGDWKHRGAHHPATSIGALTRRDRYREAALNRMIAEEYGNVAVTGSRRRRRRYLRTARRHERALLAQQRRPQSALVALGIALVVAVGVLVGTGASSSLALVATGLLFIDWQVLRRRRRRLRRR